MSVVLSIGKLGSGAQAADYYLKRQAGCDLAYYTGDGERAGVWCGAGAAALGLAGELSADGERALRALLAGQSPRGDQLVGPVLRADPRSRVPAGVVVDALRAAAERAGVTVESLLATERDTAAFGRAVEALQRARRRPNWPAPTIGVDDAGRLLRAAGVDPVEALRGSRRRDRFTAAMRWLDARVDRRLAALDFTLSAPKSVSLLYGLGDPALAAQVRAAHGTAVGQALEYMELVCARGLRGHHGGGHTYVATDGLIGVAFEHRTSRENDPQLHSHVVVANLLRGADGKWGAMDTREAFRHARTGGFVYQAVLRGELTRRLGVAWAPVRKGQAEIAGIPKPLLVLFSKRRAAIAAALQQAGRNDAAAAQAATLATRPDKVALNGASLREHWEHQATTAGHDVAVVHQVLHRTDPPTLPDAAALAARLFAADGLTRDRSSFDRRDLLRAVCEALPAGAPVTLRQLRELATQVVRAPEVVPLLADAPVAERRYSTGQLLEVEASAQADARRRADDGIATVPPSTVEAVVTGAGLSVEQAAMVRQVTTSGAGVQVIVGPAGSGKTRALAAARAAWQVQGTPVTGVALAAIAARVLEDGAGIRSLSLARLLVAVGRVDPVTGRRSGLPAGGVLVVDEAGMLGTRALAQLIALTERYRTKLVLVGDPHQLPEIEAGGLFAALVDRVPTARLLGNQRQREPWEQTALAQLRNGDVLGAVDAYREHDRVRVEETSAELKARLITDYRAARRASGPGQSLVVTSSRADARRLNREIRQGLLDAGDLGTRELVVALDSGGQRSFRVGDEVVVTANDYPRALLNGTRGRVTAVASRAGSVTVGVGDGREVTLPRGYLRNGRLAHGYALTCHRAQGMTVEVAMLWGSVALTRESGYVALSRGRRANYLYGTYDGLRHDLGADVDRPRAAGVPTLAQRRGLAHAAIVARLEMSGRQRLASSYLRRQRAGRPAAPADRHRRGRDARQLG